MWGGLVYEVGWGGVEGGMGWSGVRVVWGEAGMGGVGKDQVRWGRDTGGGWVGEERWE